MGRGIPTFAVRMQGPAQKALSAKRVDIARFLAERIEFAYIRAVRTAQDASRVVALSVSRELAAVDEDPEYQAALAKIDSLQRPAMDRLANTIRDSLHEFLPDVQSVSVKIPEEARARAFRTSVEIVVDDGTPTPLSFKGEGVQSIAALSLMRASSRARAEGKDLILAIEEPEAHLHPGAIHRLRSVIQDLSESTQVVMTTHHPAFVDRRNPANNVLVRGSRARPARNIEEIRDALGVQASDNLRHADLVVLMEGETDVQAVAALLCTSSAVLRQAIDSGRLALVPAGGCDRVPYQAAALRAELCSVHILTDYDSPGRNAAELAVRQGSVGRDEVSHLTFRGKSESELEDGIVVSAYATDVKTLFGVTIPCAAFDHNRSKWSGRMAAALAEQGRDWDSSATSVKIAVAAAVTRDPALALDPRRASSFQSLVDALETRLR